MSVRARDGVARGSGRVVTGAPNPDVGLLHQRSTANRASVAVEVK